ncbi:hypothetical protein HQ447_11380 [bacterium]|nr:hypothetical protein [bacterium]
METPSHYPLRNLPNLQRIVTHVYPRGKNFEEFAELPSLREIWLTNARNEDLQKIAVHPAFGKVETLTLSHPTADDFSGLREMPALEHLVLFYSQGSRADLSGLASLKIVTISSCSKLTELKLPASLEDLRVNSSDALEFGPASPFPHLRRLYLENCDGVKTLEPLAPCPELAEMVLLNCKRLTATAGLEKGARIKRCVIQGCGGGTTRESAE